MDTWDVTAHHDTPPLLFCVLLQEESSYSHGRATHKITVVPRVNLSVTCTVTNRLGEDSRTINVSSSKFLHLHSAGGPG